MFHTVDQVREALSISPGVPVITTDARGRLAVKETVLNLLDVVLQRAMAKAKNSESVTSTVTTAVAVPT
jgi:hypothetical protein